MPQTRLVCLTAANAAVVIDAATRPGDPHHTVTLDGITVVIDYFDARYPLDVAEYAFENGHASDRESARVIAAL